MSDDRILNTVLVRWRPKSASRPIRCGFDVDEDFFAKSSIPHGMLVLYDPRTLGHAVEDQVWGSPQMTLYTGERGPQDGA